MFIVEEAPHESTWIASRALCTGMTEVVLGRKAIPAPTCLQMPTLRPKGDLLDQFQRLEARVAVLTDDDVIVHGDAERLRDIDNLFGHLNIGLRRRGVATRMVVQNRPIRRQY